MLRPVFSRTGVPSSSTNPLGVFAVVCVWAGATGAAASCGEVLVAGACCSAAFCAAGAFVASVCENRTEYAKNNKTKEKSSVLIMTTLLENILGRPWGRGLSIAEIREGSKRKDSPDRRTPWT